MTAEEIIDGFWDGAVFQEAIRIGMELNNQYHTPEEIREIMGRLTGKKVDDAFRLFPPFYTDFGKNITIGRDVFINSGCHFQDQGGIIIGDGSLIGHNVVFLRAMSQGQTSLALATDVTDGRADWEQGDPSARPAISGSVLDMSQYDVIVLGYPKMEYGFNCVSCI